MSRLTELLRRVEQRDPALAKELASEVKVLSGRRAFGLNFERHVPETVELPGRRVRRGDKVRFVAPCSEDARADERLWLVTRVEGRGEARTAHLVEYHPAGEPETVQRPVADLVVVAEFRDPICPGLRSTGAVKQGGDKPYHTVINGENYHALKALLFAYEGRVDCIYIDPPYNTGARDWKYSNDYVDRDDAYRHSKWLAMMERRLKIAKRLLNANNSVLIVTIDEKEYLRLGLLLEHTFTGADIQMVSNVINRAGSPRRGRFSRVDEYLYYVFMGEARVTPWSSTMLPDSQESTPTTMPTVWFTAVRRGSGASRAESKSLFYPVVIDAETGAFKRVGEHIPRNVDRNDVQLGSGDLAIWPMGADGGENRWRFSASLMRTYFANGTARLGRRDPETGLRPVTYLQPGTLRNIENGTFVVTGRTDDGTLQLSLGETAKAVAPRTVWSLTGHFARDHGSHLLGALIGNRKFPFPKALYAVEDGLRFVVKDKPDAVVLDFFAGSGTTAHAVMRLNRQDDGRRRSIMITNNEVSDEEARRLRSQRHRPGDPEWEAQGICEYITKPRVRAAITGQTPEGSPIRGEYKFTDEFPMAEGFKENAEFFDLTYEDPERVRHDMAFTAIAPLLWMKAGSEGRKVETPTDTFDVAETYCVLFNLDAAGAFVREVRDCERVRIAYIVTDDEKQFQLVAAELPHSVQAVRLYESYLGTFRITGDD